MKASHVTGACLACGVAIDHRATRCNHCERLRRHALADKRVQPEPPPSAWCSLDGLPLRTHPRCEACEVLCGLAHVYVLAAGGLCNGCAGPPVPRPVDWRAEPWL